MRNPVPVMVFSIITVVAALGVLRAVQRGDWIPALLFGSILVLMVGTYVVVQRRQQRK